MTAKLPAAISMRLFTCREQHKKGASSTLAPLVRFQTSLDSQTSSISDLYDSQTSRASSSGTK